MERERVEEWWECAPGGIEQRLEPAALAFKIQTWQRLPALSCSTGGIIPPARSIYTVRVRV